MLNAEIYDSLKTSDLSKYLDPQELNMLFLHSKVLTFVMGDTILQQGKECEGIYIIIHGNVTMTAKILGNGITNLEMLTTGNFLGEVSFIEKIPNATSAIASSEVKCLFISHTYIDLLTMYFPKTKYNLFNAISKQVCTRLKKMHDKVIDFISSTDMATQSVFSKIMHSLAKPTEITVDDIVMSDVTLNESLLFCCFTKNDIDELFKHATLLKAPKNCTLIHKGEKNLSCYIVIHGAVQSSIMHDNKAAKLSVIGPGKLFTSIACVDDTSPFTITFATCEQAVLLKLSEETLAIIEKSNVVIWYKISDLICKSLVALEKSVDKLDVRLNIEAYNR